MTKITKRSQFPKWLQQFKEVKGVSIGSCIDPTWNMGKAAAHAHTLGKYKGWICFRYKYYVKRLIVLHEAAHLLIDPTNAPHGGAWREAVARIGGTYKTFSYSIKPTKKNPDNRMYFPNYSFCGNKKRTT